MKMFLYCLVLGLFWSTLHQLGYVSVTWMLVGSGLTGAALGIVIGDKQVPLTDESKEKDPQDKS